MIAVTCDERIEIGRGCGGRGHGFEGFLNHFETIRYLLASYDKIDISLDVDTPREYVE